MGDSLESLPNDVGALKAALVAERGRRIVAETDAAFAKARASDDQALIAHLKLQIEKLNRDRYGSRSERTARLLDQLELTLEELEASATEDELAAEMAAARTANATTAVASFTRKRPSRQPFPDHLPRQRVIVPGPTACLCCGGERLRKLGETVTETLESIPRQWKVIQQVRGKFTCRDCEKISQAPAPSRTGRRCHGAFRCRDDEVLAERGRFRIIVLLILDDHGAAAQHLLLLVGAQCFRP